MHKKFELELPLSYEESFKIIEESGQEVSEWSLEDSDPETGYVEWKQIFWSAYGFAKIKEELKEIEKQSSLAIISIYRPIQIWDPAKICDKVFKKLERNIVKKMN